MYIVFFIAVFAPPIATGINSALDLFQNWDAAGVLWCQLFSVGPICTILGLHAILCQCAEAEALSALTLASQAVVFAVLGTTWAFRFYLFVDGDSEIEGLLFVSWLVVDNLVFAFVQFVLLCTSLDGKRSAARAIRLAE